MYCDIELIKKKDIDGLTESMEDIQINHYIEESTKNIDKYIGYSIYNTYEEYGYYDLSVYDDKIFFRKPINSIKSVYDCNTEVQVVYNKGSRKLSSRYLNNSKHKFTTKLVVKGYFGYDTIPYDIQEACALMSLWYIENKDSLDIGNIKSEKVDFAETTYAKPSNSNLNEVVIPLRIKNILSKYAFVRFASL